MSLMSMQAHTVHRSRNVHLVSDHEAAKPDTGTDTMELTVDAGAQTTRNKHKTYS